MSWGGGGVVDSFAREDFDRNACSCVFLEVVNNKFFFYKLVSSFILWCDDKLLLSKLLYLHGIYYNVIRQDPNHDIF
jgi:hypothetical protein